MRKKIYKTFNLMRILVWQKKKKYIAIHVKYTKVNMVHYKKILKIYLDEETHHCKVC